MRLVVAVALLAFSACGLGASPSRSSVATISLVREIDGSMVGYTSWRGGSTIEVVVKDNLGPVGTAAVLCHELWHVAGYSAHLDDVTCVGSMNGAQHLCTPLSNTFAWLYEPCDEEKAAILSSDWPFTLRPDDEVRDATVYAADWWNERLGREVFVVDSPVGYREGP